MHNINYIKDYMYKHMKAQPFILHLKNLMWIKENPDMDETNGKKISFVLKTDHRLSLMRLGETTLNFLPQGQINVITKTHEEYQKDIKVIKKSQRIKIKIYLSEKEIKNFLILFLEATNIIKKRIINHYNSMLYMSLGSLKLYFKIIENEIVGNIPFLHTYD